MPLVEVAHHAAHAQLVARAVRQRPEPDGRCQQAVHRDVRVAPDGGGEVRVGGRRQAVVVELWCGQVTRAEVERLRHAARGHDADELVEVAIVLAHRVVQRVRQRLGAADVDVHVRRHRRAQERLKLARRRRCVAAQDRQAGEGLHNLLRDRHVGHQHHLLHHLVGLPHLVHAHIQWVQRLRLQLELDLGGRELQRAGLHSARAQHARHRQQPAQAQRDVVVRLGIVDAGLRLLVGQRGARADDSLREVRVHDLDARGARPRGCHLPGDREG
mmetsp:Transcript_24123/g.62696  ORF Transcript_24123/g.62696 Transcript_24123/m.62696 type:complete len:272 (-) Transcript_24123:602-1417(-)